MAEASTSLPDRPTAIRLRYKIIAYIGAWIIALLLTAPGLWALAWMFPLGLVAIFNRHLANDGGWGILIGCYVAYVVHAFFYFQSKTNARTIVLYAVLVSMLLGNIAGCREMIPSH